MAFQVSSLTDYVNQSSTDLLVAAQFENKTAALAGLNIQYGVKSASALQLLSFDAIPQANDSGCGFNASGDTTITQKTITTKGVKFDGTLCPKTLEAKWTQMLLSKGQNYTESAIPAAIFNEMTKSIAKRLEIMDWQGDTSLVSSYLNRYDGLIKTINAATPVSATASTYNATNARAIVKNIISNIPSALKGNPDVKIFMGYDAAEIYRQALMDANLYHVAAGADMEALNAEGSVHQIIPVHGLDGLYSVSGQKCIYAFNPANVVLGCDMLNEEEKIDVWFSPDNQDVRHTCRFKRGWAVAYGSECVQYANS